MCENLGVLVCEESGGCECEVGFVGWGRWRRRGIGGTGVDLTFRLEVNGVVC